MNHIDLLESKETYASGKNITKYLRAKFGESQNTSEIIEMAYDLQAGSYIEYVNTNRDKVEKQYLSNSKVVSFSACQGSIK